MKLIGTEGNIIKKNRDIFVAVYKDGKKKEFPYTELEEWVKKMGIYATDAGNIQIVD